MRLFHSPLGAATDAGRADEEITNSKHDAPKSRGTGAVEVHPARGEQSVKLGGHQALQQSELVGIVVVESRAIHGGRVGNVLDRKLLESFRFKEHFQRLLQEQTRAPDPGIDAFGTGFSHQSGNVTPERIICHQLSHRRHLLLKPVDDE